MKKGKKNMTKVVEEVEVEEQVTERNIFTPWIVLIGATVSSNGGGAAGKEVSPDPKCW